MGDLYVAYLQCSLTPAPSFLEDGAAEVTVNSRQIHTLSGGNLHVPRPPRKQTQTFMVFTYFFGSVPFYCHSLSTIRRAFFAPSSPRRVCGFVIVSADHKGTL